MERKPLVACMYGWGKALRLYRDHLDLNGVSYQLRDLLFVRPIHLRVMGIASIRLELHFKQNVITLRGIAALKEAHELVEYINSRNEMQLTSDPTVSIPAMHAQDTVPIIPAPEETPVILSASPISPYRYWDYSPIAPATVPSSQAHSQAPTTPIEYEKYVWDSSETGSQTLKCLPPKHPRIEPALRAQGFAIEPTARRLHEERLPQIQVPLHLLPEEHAHYCTRATLYSEAPDDSTDYRYQSSDRGTLILTNMRLIYLGRKHQIVLNYERLLHVARLPGALSFLAEHWSRHEIFAVTYPQEFTTYLEYILQNFQQRLQSAYVEDGREP